MTVVPMYMNEISPQKLAGSMGTLFCIGICTGVFVSQLLGLDSLLGKLGGYECCGPMQFSCYNVYLFLARYSNSMAILGQRLLRLLCVRFHSSTFHARESEISSQRAPRT